MANKKFRRSSDNKILGGVCGGIAEFFGWDATIVRIVTAALGLLGGSGVVLYVLIWLFIPDSGTGDIGLDGVFDFYKAHRDRPSDHV